MTKTALAIIFLVIQPALLFAQDSSGRKWAVSLMPVHIPLPGNFTGIQPGIEIKFSNHLRFLTDFAFTLPQKKHDSSALNRKYLRIKPELRYILPYKGKDLFYIGLQMSYSFRSFNDASGYGYYFDHFPDDSVYYFSSAHIKSPVFTASFQMGTFLFDKKRISLDAFFGLGPRFVNTTYSEIVNLQFLPGQKQWIALTPSYRRKGNVTLIYLNWGLRFFYHFNLLKKHLKE
ncbi:MAG: hypothetical protein ABUT20_04230 [Bacteroidota bacterium]